ncbi:monocyte to macrophage differentiation factor 2-like isoform X2 [Cavia porcellus]|uniref:monocyte to macrophage differentiation factor 2-like isoform X2 n=1 Tax=Cavia porcellus TaxID=10141 RepID=UPI002FE12A92
MNHRVPPHKRYQPTEYEHAANCATHAFWILPSILGGSNLYFLSDDDWETISAWIYSLGLCGLFVVSTVFHTISWKKSHLSLTMRFRLALNSKRSSCLSFLGLQVCTIMPGQIPGF